MRILLSGCCGRMGRVITGIANNREDCEVVAGLDRVLDPNLPFPVFANSADCDVDYDVLIDFSNPSALPGVIDLSKRTGKPLVVATTGLSERETADLNRLSQTNAVFTSANMSLGINILIKLARDAAKTLYPDFNIEIIEAHHNQKVDAPSGTALMIADEIKDALDDEAVFYRYERQSFREKRVANEIGISAIRGGTIVGEHDVMFAGSQEVLTIKHSAQSREVFGEGAIAAALFLHGKKPGHYDMNDLISASID
ncbi:MAG: 4-hydroxy-tetrahydrodipicolinate reductase [Fastidiosipilaceae bacterium]|jgi:4-hydroxy-tetrahydrodipicolinate reductase